MEKLLGSLSFASFRTGRFLRNDDDLADRLSHRYTTFVFVIFAVVVSTKQYSGEPINCWCPAYFTSNFVDYTNKVCWISNTYHVPVTEKSLPDDPGPGRLVNYYQWVPIILLFQAFLFQLPHLLWQSLNSRAGIDVGGIVEAGMLLQTLDHSQSREKLVEYMKSQMCSYLGATPDARKGRWARSRQFLAQNFCWLCGRTYGNYLVGTYLISKCVYVVNAVCQLVILNVFIRLDYHVYGIEVLQDLLGQREYGVSVRFPRVTWCDFSVRQLKTVHHHTVQCVLPINLFNEKIFIFIWFWLVLVAIVASTSFVLCLVRCLFYMNRVDYIKLHLKRSPLLNSQERGTEVKTFSRQFVKDFLKPDGVLILRLMEQNANQIIAVELMVALWKHFRSSPGMREQVGHSDDV